MQEEARIFMRNLLPRISGMLHDKVISPQGLLKKENRLAKVGGNKQRKLLVVYLLECKQNGQCLNPLIIYVCYDMEYYISQYKESLLKACYNAHAI